MDRATLFNLLIGLNGYTVCSGVIDKELNGENIIAIPLKACLLYTSLVSCMQQLIQLHRHA